MSLPTYNASIITAITKVQQDLPFPQFLIGGQGASSSYKIFKKTTSYLFSVWRSKVFNIGQNFDVAKITFPIIPDMAANMSIIPVLYFDNQDSNSIGNTINSTTYPNSERLIKLTAKNFNNAVHGRSNFFLELQFTGSALIVVGLPITIDIDVTDA